MYLLSLLFFNLTFLYNAVAEVHPPEMVKIPGGLYQPFFDQSKDGKSKNEISVKSFYLDKYPVTNGLYLEFVKKYHHWKRSQVKEIFAEKNYLKHWISDLKVAKEDLDKPVRNVSWFGALEYCQSKGKTLPSVVQWEFVAAADEKKAFAMDDESYKQKILKWYSRPSIDQLPSVGQGEENFFGVYDLHGLHWEWTRDFNTALVTGESREDESLNRNKFCGSGSLSAKDKLDYGAFMRFGFRSSLKGNYTLKNLGFRCAKEAL